MSAQARPPRLHSNLQYVQRFRSPIGLKSEAGCYFTHLQAAACFLSSLAEESAGGQRPPSPAPALAWRGGDASSDDGRNGSDSVSNDSVYASATSLDALDAEAPPAQPQTEPQPQQQPPSQPPSRDQRRTPPPQPAGTSVTHADGDGVGQGDAGGVGDAGAGRGGGDGGDCDGDGDGDGEAPSASSVTCGRASRRAASVAVALSGWERLIECSNLPNLPPEESRRESVEELAPRRPSSVPGCSPLPAAAPAAASSSPAHAAASSAAATSAAAADSPGTGSPPRRADEQSPLVGRGATWGDVSTDPPTDSTLASALAADGGHAATPESAAAQASPAPQLSPVVFVADWDEVGRRVV